MNEWIDTWKSEWIFSIIYNRRLSSWTNDQRQGHFSKPRIPEERIKAWKWIIIRMKIWLLGGQLEKEYLTLSYILPQVGFPALDRLKSKGIMHMKDVEADMECSLSSHWYFIKGKTVLFPINSAEIHTHTHTCIHKLSVTKEIILLFQFDIFFFY